MLSIDPRAASAVERSLASGENLICAGCPVQSKIFHEDDLLKIPFSLMWGGFAIFWECAAAGLWGHARGEAPAEIFGIPFVLAGQYFIWGRFIYAAWKEQETFYALTNRRVIAVQSGSLASFYLESLPA